MKLKEWSAEFEIGISAIDKDHRNLFNTIHGLGRQIAEGAENERIEATIHALNLYVDEHFEREELFMRRAGYPDYHAHKKRHDDFCDTIMSLKKFHQTYPDDVDAGKIVAFLEDWLLNHIMKEDTLYAPYLRGEEKGGAPMVRETGADGESLKVQIACPVDKEGQVRHFIELISQGSEEGHLVEAAVEKITEVQKSRREKKARELFGK